MFEKLFPNDAFQNNFVSITCYKEFIVIPGALQKKNTSAKRKITRLQDTIL